jgi:putative effector of murein hydrolase
MKHMKQTNDLSTLVAGMVTEVVTGVITGVTSARRLYYRNLLLVAIVVAGITFAIAVAFRNHLPGVSAPTAQDDISAPTRGRRPEPTPRARDDAEELRRLTRPNPM